MKKLRFTNATFIVCCILLCAVYFTGCCELSNNKQIFNDEVSAGQIWVYEMNTKNPFEEIVRDTMYVIDVRGDYVQYKKEGIIRSMSINWFIVGSRRIK
jgi:hypothetical protein